jgi:hypothetical protein
MKEGTPSSLPLSALLSQALVAFTIEADNEAELRTTSKGVGMPRSWVQALLSPGGDPVQDCHDRRGDTSMRLGKEQASGYVEDSVTDSIAADESPIDSEERARPAPVPEPVAIASPAQPVG